MSTATETADVQVWWDGGSIAQLTPLTTEGQEWFDENVESEGWQWMGGSLCIEPRYVDMLVAGLDEAGLSVEDMS